MKKRLRKKRLKKTLRKLLALFDDYDVVCECAFRKALRDVVDSLDGPKETFYAAFRRYMEVAYFLSYRRIQPRFFAELRRKYSSPAAT